MAATGQVFSFKKLALRRFPKTTEVRNNAEEKYWSKYKVPVTVKELATVTHIHFSPASPYNFAVTSGARIQIYSPRNNEVLRRVSHFKEAAYGGRFRHDGKLLVAGGQEGVVKVFDMSSRAILRELTGHTRAVHTVDFSCDGLKVFSGSDDRTVVYWDMAEGRPASTLTGHQDYVRCGAVVPSTDSLFLSGSYDHTLRLWDTRSGNCVAVMDHGAPVECLLPFASGAAALSAGGNVVKVWDLLGGNQPIATFSNHQKTITSLCFDGRQQRLLSGGLDKQVKVYSLETYSVVHHLSYPAPILCMAVSPDDSHLVVGMTDHLLSIRQREPSKEGETDIDSDFPFLSSHPSVSRRRFLRRGGQSQPLEDEAVVANPRGKKLLPYERHLKDFEYRRALDAALATTHKGRVGVVYSVLQELVRRSGLKVALSGRTEEELIPVLQFLARNVTDPHYMPLLIDVCVILLDIYGDHVRKGSKTESLLLVLKTKLDVEVRVQRDLLELKGLVETIDAMSARKPAQTR